MVLACPNTLQNLKLLSKSKVPEHKIQYFIVLIAKDEVIDPPKAIFHYVAKDGVPEHQKSIFHYTSCKTRDSKAREPIKKGSRLKKN